MINNLLNGAAGHPGLTVQHRVAREHDKDCDLAWASLSVVVRVQMSRLDPAPMKNARPGPVGQAGAIVLPNVTVVLNLEPELVPLVTTKIVQDLPLTNNNAIDNLVVVK